jgi:hypothetical protein
VKKEWWLDFDSEKFLNPEDGFCYLGVKVLSDNYGGNRAETIISFNTENYGGNQIGVEGSGGSHDPKMRGFKAEFGTLNITLRGGVEATDFFEAMRNLVKAYDMREQLGG